MNKIEWLESKDVNNCGDNLYSLNALKRDYKVKDLGNYTYLILKEDDNVLDFALMKFHHSDTDYNNMFVYCIFYGYGFPEIRECRHTYWGDNGYIFYPDRDAIIQGLNALTEFFDMD